MREKDRWKRERKRERGREMRERERDKRGIWKREREG